MQSSGRRPALAGLGRLWYNRRFRAWLFQAVVLVLVLAVIVAMFGNASHALALRGIRTGFGFLTSETGFSISDSLWPFNSTDAFFVAFLVGLTNTLWVSAWGIVGATILGLLIGIARLSSNWLVARIALSYVEAFRNTPQLIQIILWYTVLTHFPSPKQAWHLSDWAYLSSRGLMVAWPVDHTVLLAAVAAFCMAVAVVVAWRRLTASRRRAAGIGVRSRWPTVALVVGAPLLVWLAAGAPMAIEFPTFRGFGFHGGVAFSTEFVALVLGLGLYIAAYIAEIVRAGILSVDRGQIEAGRAIGLHRFDLFRRIVLPQALRVIVPPVTAQYISLVKNSALGVAIGYPELFNITNSILVASGHTLECVLIMGMIYLAISFAIAAIMNVYNYVVYVSRGAART